MVDKKYNRTILFYLKKNHLTDPGRSAIRLWSQFPGSNIWHQKKQVFKALFLLIIATVWAAGHQPLQAQTGITEINATYDDITDTSDDYTASGIDYNFNVGSQNNLNVDNVDIGGNIFEPVRFADRLNIVRVDNGEVSGDKQLMFYEQESVVGAPITEVNLKPSFQNTMEEVLLNVVVNRGSDNIFGNQGDGAGNNNNIERLDFIFDDGIVVPSNTNDEGFVIFERGGNDSFIIAPILSLDGSGNPASYGNFVTITTEWGTSSISITTEVMSSPDPSSDLERTITVGTQDIAGVLISFNDFGLSSGDTIFGYSLAGGDVNLGTSDDLLNVTDDTIFPTNTSSTSGAEGGMDMIAGGSFFSSSLVETSVSLEGGACWRMLSSPVSTTYAGLLDGLWTQGAPGADYTGGDSNVLLWPDVSGEDPADWTAPASLNDAIPAGTGFIISVFDDDDFDGIDDGFPKTLSISGTGNSGTISPPTMNTNASGWTLVGNPYSEPIDFDLVTKTDLTDVAYVYDRNAGGTTNGNSGGWRSTDGSVGEVHDGIISPVQGFFVQNSGASPNITFEEAHQTTGGTFYGKHKEEDRHVIRMELNGEGLVNSAWLTFSESGNVEQIHGDAWELLPFSEQYATLATRKSGDELLDIAHFPVSDAPVEIPVHVATTTPGSYSLQITDMDLPPDAELILTDHQLGREVPLGENSEYEFTIESAHKENPLTVQCSDHANTLGKVKPSIATAETGDRFSISLKSLEAKTELPKETTLGQNYPNPFNPSTVISYQLPATSEVQLEVFDLLGRQVANLVQGTVEAGVHQVNFDAGHLTSGVYLYRLTAVSPQGGMQVFTRKLTLIK